MNIKITGIYQYNYIDTPGGVIDYADTMENMHGEEADVYASVDAAVIVYHYSDGDDIREYPDYEKAVNIASRRGFIF